jgi:tetratricopeptide (TPR) repeat protein
MLLAATAVSLKQRSTAIAAARRANEAAQHAREAEAAADKAREEADEDREAAKAEARRADENARKLQVALGQLESKQHELEGMLDELRDELMDKVLAAVMSGDTDKAEAAIARARSVGVSESWIRIFEGQLALYSGQPDRAIRLLEQEAKENVAAHALLAMSLVSAGRIEEAVIEVDDVLERDPETLEDRLFLTQIQCSVKPVAAKEMAESAVRDRDSPVARMIYAWALAHVALDGGDEKAIEMALREIEAARVFLGDTPFVLTTYVFAVHVALNCGVLSPDQCRALITADMVAEMKRLPAARLELARYFEDLGDHETAVTIWEASTQMSDHEMLTYIPCALAHKTPQQVLDDIDAFGDATDPYTQLVQALVMTLMPEKREQARKICVEQCGVYSTYDVRAGFLEVLTLLGHANHARELARDLMDDSVSPDRYKREVLQHIAGEIDTGPLLQKAVGSNVNGTMAYFSAAISELALGNREKARSHFEQCVEKGLFVSGYYWWAKALLRHMEKDPGWPPCCKTEDHPE